jgi:serine/threonine protein phosphatase PrpC
MSSSTTTTPTFDLALLRCAAGTDVGMRREENQDSFGVIRREPFHAYFVADGMGGAQGGATASRMAISLLTEALHDPNARVSPAQLTSVIESINRRIFEKGSTEPACAGMGTTLVGLVFTPEALLELNVGDSRAYRVRGDSIIQISEDHTLVRELVQSGAIAPEDAQHHPVSHMLTRSLGPLGEVQVECRIIPEQPQTGDVYILCSDGLYNYVSQQDIIAVVKQNPLDDANQILINLANQRGGSDNITAVVIAVGEKPVRGRKPTIPPVSVESDVEQETAALITPVEQAFEEAPVIPPPIKEPTDINAERKALRQRQRTTLRGPRPIPTAFLLGVTLVFGLFLGNFARRFSFEGPGIFRNLFGFKDSTDDGTSRDSAAPHDANPLAVLAKQIGSDRNESGGILSSSPSETRRQPAQLEQSIQRLQAQLQALNQIGTLPKSDLYDKARQEVLRAEKNYQAIEANLDVASRLVTLWLGRQVAFEGQELSVDSLSEMARVGTYSPVVKNKVDLFTSLSYEYRQKADEVELHPEDTDLQSELSELDERREALKKELVTDLLQAIKQNLAKSFKDYETTKLQRDVLWLELQSAKREVEIQRVIAEGDPVKREELRQALQERLGQEQKALANVRAAAGR